MAALPEVVWREPQGDLSLQAKGQEVSPGRALQRPSWRECMGVSWLCTCPYPVPWGCHRRGAKSHCSQRQPQPWCFLHACTCVPARHLRGAPECRRHLTVLGLGEEVPAAAQLQSSGDNDGRVWRGAAMLWQTAGRYLGSITAAAGTVRGR